MNVAAGVGARERAGSGAPEVLGKRLQLRDNPAVTVPYMKIS